MLAQRPQPTNPGGDRGPGLPRVVGSGIHILRSWDIGDAESSISKLLILFNPSTDTEVPQQGGEPDGSPLIQFISFLASLESISKKFLRCMLL